MQSAKFLGWFLLGRFKISNPNASFYNDWEISHLLIGYFSYSLILTTASLSGGWVPRIYPGASTIGREPPDWITPLLLAKPCNSVRSPKPGILTKQAVITLRSHWRRIPKGEGWVGMHFHHVMRQLYHQQDGRQIRNWCQFVKISLACCFSCECTCIRGFFNYGFIQDILPNTYSTTLYFSLEELQQLKGSPAFGRMYCNSITYTLNYLAVFLH